MVARRVGMPGLLIAMLCIAASVGLSDSSADAAVGAAEDALDVDDQQQRPVLVLGSGGLVGRALVRWLKLHSFRVLEVKNREDIDLREPGAMDRFNASHAQFVYFLACEVGGSKFLESSSEAQQLAIIRHNLRIYETVLNWFEEEVARRRQAGDDAGRPLMRGVFTSSYLQHMHNGYGAVKRVGEEWGASLSRGSCAVAARLRTVLLLLFCCLQYGCPSPLTQLAPSPACAVAAAQCASCLR